MDLQASDHGPVRVIHVHEPRIDAASAIQFKDRMRDMTDEAPDRVLLDLAQVDFIDSSGLGAIVATMKFLAPARRLELATMGPTVAKVFRLTRMDQVFTIHGQVSDAL
jgi:anti-sigma B factor antagonist